MLPRSLAPPIEIRHLEGGDTVFPPSPREREPVAAAGRRHRRK